MKNKGEEKVCTYCNSRLPIAKFKPKKDGSRFERCLACVTKISKEGIPFIDTDEWKAIDGYKGVYIVNREGEVINRKLNLTMTSKLDSHGYYILNLSLDGNKTKFYIHRLIATYFIPNPENKPTVNHIDGIKTNNSLSNLEWATYKENNNHAFDTGLIGKGENHHFYGKKGELCHNSKQVISNDTGQIFESVEAAAIHYGISRPHMSSMLTGSRRNKLNVSFYSPTQFTNRQTITTYGNR